MRLRITFSKTEAMRFTGHLDVHRTWERTIRRARLPLVYSQGFNPRPKINLAAALPLGFTSSCEILEMWLEQDFSEVELQTRLQEAAPPGIVISKVEAIDSKAPKIPNLTHAAEYTVTLIDPFDDLENRTQSLLNSETLPRDRRGKAYDLRPLIESIDWIDPNQQGEKRFKLRLAARTGATGRPDEVLDAMDIMPHQARVHRSQLFLKPL
jgi:radical SAM-linked protein